MHMCQSRKTHRAPRKVWRGMGEVMLKEKRCQNIRKEESTGHHTEVLHRINRKGDTLFHMIMKMHDIEVKEKIIFLTDHPQRNYRWTADFSLAEDNGIMLSRC